jgi:hypothetical protein
MKTEIRFNRNETNIIVSILSKKMGANLPKKNIDTSILPNLLKGRESEVIKWIKQIPQDAIIKYNIEKAIHSAIEKLSKAITINEFLLKGQK